MRGAMSSDSGFPMKGYVDIHVHILPGFDDGARTEDQAVIMADIASKSGTMKVVATPHIDPSGLAPNCSKAQSVRETTLCIQESIDSHGIPVEVVPGMEIAIAPGLVEHLIRGAIIPISNSTRYVLVELPFQSIPSYAEDEIFNIAAHGYIPIIAHPERNAEVIRNPNVLMPFLRAGALTQVNAGSLLGRGGREPQEATEILITHGFAHIIASDGHSPKSRSPRLNQAFEAASRIVGEGEALKMVRDIPLAITLGKDVKVKEPEVYRAPRKWWQFWRKDGS